MTGMRQTIQCSLALTPAHQGEARVTGYQGAESVVAKPAPERPALTEQVHVPDQAYPSRTAGYVTRMPGGVGGVAPRGVPLSRSSTQSGRSRLPTASGAVVEGFGRRPITGLPTGTGAVVRKPSGKEPAGCGPPRCRSLYGDFDTAVEDAAADDVAGGVIAELRGGSDGARVAGQ